MANRLTDTVNFQFIRYANCWEDADILSTALDIEPGGKILSIASAGDNSFSLLLKEPKLLVAVDVNQIQLFLTELKKACFKNLAYGETLEFLGFHESTKRRELFDLLKKDLGNEALNHWEKHFEQIASGLIHQGKFEKYFQLFCKKILPWIHSKKTVHKLFEPKTEQEQKEFYDKHWNTWRWRLLFKIFFSKRVMGKYGRDPEFLKQVNVKVSDYIFSRAEKQLSGTQVFSNFILRYNLTANFGKLLPHYLQPEHYETIKRNLDNFIVVKGYAEDAIGKYGPFDAMNLSNIFEYLDNETFKSVSGKLVTGLQPNGKIAYWNLMVPRMISKILPNELVYDEGLSKKMETIDKGFFYSRFIIENKL